MSRLLSVLFVSILAISFATVSQAGQRLKALIIDGQNNHAMWPGEPFGKAFG